MEEHLIDTELEKPSTDKDILMEILRWWERKRLLFNLIMLCIILLAVIPYLYFQTDALSHILDASFITRSILYFVFINTCYCAGWGIQMLGYYYFKITYDSNVLDYFFFIIGSLFTGYVTYFGYIEFLYY